MPIQGKIEKQSASFRDSSGFLFWKNGVLYRQVNKVFAENYELLMRSGLYKELTSRGFLIPHSEVKVDGLNPEAHKVVKPEFIPFISYPYEWCFSELKDAAILTLEIQKVVMEFGMSLRDASAYNIQFHNGRPILIDTLSFEKYEESKPWVAYRQFCQHFLAPLALMSFRDLRLNQLLRIYIDGIPLDLTSKLLPVRTNFKAGLFFHLHLHAKSQKRFAGRKIESSSRKINKSALLGLLESLGDAVKSLKIKFDDTDWANYYEITNYSDAAMRHKKEIVSEFLAKVNPKSVWDLGANDGLFSRLASSKGIFTLAFDIDPVAVEKNYLRAVAGEEKDILPLILDLTNPSPAMGWANEERMSFIERRPADLLMTLALVHHLVISNNLPFLKIASFFSRICKFLIIEFIPKEDSQVKKLLLNRADSFSNYSQKEFESEFSEFFVIKERREIKDSKRIMYLMARK